QDGDTATRQAGLLLEANGGTGEAARRPSASRGRASPGTGGGMRAAAYDIRPASAPDSGDGRGAAGVGERGQAEALGEGALEAVGHDQVEVADAAGGQGGVERDSGSTSSSSWASA